MKDTKMKSKKALIKSLIKGSRFTTPDGGIIYFDKNQSNPFRYLKNSVESDSMEGTWDYYKEVVKIN